MIQHCLANADWAVELRSLVHLTLASIGRPPSLARHTPTASKFSSAMPIGSMI